MLQVVAGLVTSGAFVLVYCHDLSQLPVALATSLTFDYIHQWLLRYVLATPGTFPAQLLNASLLHSSRTFTVESSFAITVVWCVAETTRRYLAKAEPRATKQD